MTLRELTKTLAPHGLHLHGVRLSCVDAREITDTEVAIARWWRPLEIITILNAPRINGSFLAQLSDNRISRVHLFDVPLRDDACEHLANLDGLTSLVLRGCHIGTHGLRALARCPRLTHLEISTRASRVDARALLDFAGHEHLRSVSLEAPGLRHVRGLPQALPHCLITLTDATT